ncbi:hypothetical protein PI93_019510 [Pandoraea fibrosis]|uniref:Surface presentation of antigen domain-containing protein n=1 Tax=Pandoraea fibrosis TaxID=1891094 RepID=A0ABX6HUM1_9BURK|nr:hypothetical protein [Pandoraea fibrosis]QHE91843.1 hypothetical protein PJ20_008490 [Pandoraea fibrosis]QHF14599.1 hypothetical protein PI93_019510 [Pandoraea fibrosis]
MKFEKAGAPRHGDPIFGDAASAPALIERVQAAAAQLSENPLGDLAQLASVDSNAGAGTGEFVFRFYGGSPIPLEVDDDDDDWKLPNAIPMYVDVTLRRAVPEPPVEAAPGGATNAPLDDTDVQRNTHSALDRPIPNPPQQVPGGLRSALKIGVTPSRHSESSPHAHLGEKTHKGGKPTRARSLGQAMVRRSIGRTSDVADAEPQPEVADIRDVHLPNATPHGGQGPRHHAGDRGESAKDGRSDDDRAHAPVVAARVSVPFSSPSLLSKDDVPQERPQSRMVRQLAKDASQAAAETASSESANHSDAYEITYRFTSWGATASVKLNVDGSQLGRAIVATPSDPRVHKALRAGISKKPADAEKNSVGLPIRLASPSAPVISVNEQEQERHRQPQVPPEEGEQ